MASLGHNGLDNSLLPIWCQIFMLSCEGELPLPTVNVIFSSLLGRLLTTLRKNELLDLDWNFQDKSDLIQETIVDILLIFWIAIYVQEVFFSLYLEVGVGWCLPIVNIFQDPSDMIHRTIWNIRCSGSPSGDLGIFFSVFDQLWLDYHASQIGN